MCVFFCFFFIPHETMRRSNLNRKSALYTLNSELCASEYFWEGDHSFRQILEEVRDSRKVKISDSQPYSYCYFPVLFISFFFFLSSYLLLVLVLLSSPSSSFPSSSSIFWFEAWSEDFYFKISLQCYSAASYYRCFKFDCILSHML